MQEICVHVCASGLIKPLNKYLTHFNLLWNSIAIMSW